MCRTPAIGSTTRERSSPAISSRDRASDLSRKTNSALAPCVTRGMKPANPAGNPIGPGVAGDNDSEQQRARERSTARWGITHDSQDVRGGHGLVGEGVGIAPREEGLA